MTMFLNATADINTMVGLANQSKNLINPEAFYNKQLLDTIRIDAKEYIYYGLADSLPIEGKADKFTIRRWAPLQAHTVPLVEGVPPQSDKGSVERFELTAFQYGRFMEFSDLVDLKVVDPVIAFYTKEYALVAIETLDLLAREALFMVANAYYAGGAANFEALKIPEGATVNAKPNMTDLRQIVLAFKRMLVKPRMNSRYKVICSAEFTYDMVSDPTVEKFMTINQTTKEMYDGSVLFPMFNMEFNETMVCPAHGEFYKMVDGAPMLHKRLVQNVGGTIKYVTINENTYLVGSSGDKVCTDYSGYVMDSRTGRAASYIPNQKIWNLADLVIAAEDGGAAISGWEELKVHHVLVIGKDALARTGLSGEGSARMYVKPKGSAGVLDPIDQRQSIGFKINSVGFGSIRTEAVVDYMCIPTQANLINEFITLDVGFTGPDVPPYVKPADQRSALLSTINKLADELNDAAADFYGITVTSEAATTTSGATDLTPEIEAGTGESYYVLFTDDEPYLYAPGTVLPISTDYTKDADGDLTELAAGGKDNVGLLIVEDATGVIVHAGKAAVTAKA